MNDLHAKMTVLNIREGRDKRQTEIRKKVGLNQNPQRRRKISIVIPPQTSRKLSLPVKAKDGKEKYEYYSILPKVKRNSTGGIPTRIVKQESGDELSDWSSESSDGSSMTPQPGLFEEFSQQNLVQPPRLRMRQCTYQPRYCLCTRCELMHRMYKESDNKLNERGNYPCFRF